MASVLVSTSMKKRKIREMINMIAFVILHYNTIEHTLACIENIKAMIDTTDFHIIVVDNASPNKTEIELSNLYEKDTTVTVLCSKDNVGFAKGNNIGFKYAKNILKAKYIVLLNGDTRILTKNLSYAIEKEYAQFNAGVIGPLIISGDGKVTSNPMRDMPVDFQTAKKFISEYNGRLWGITHGVIGFAWGKIYDIFFRVRKKIERRFARDCVIKDIWLDRIQRRENIVLHGCFLVFTPLYINRFDGLYERTFMYMEEDFLSRRCELSDIEMSYCPEIIIYHYEGGSTAKGKSITEKKRFYYEQSLKSLELYCDFLKENNLIL